MQDPTEQATDMLRSLIRPGDTVFCVERPTATYNYVEVHVAKNGDMMPVGYYASLLLGMAYDRRMKGVRVEKFYESPSAQVTMELDRMLFNGEHEPLRYRVL